MAKRNTASKSMIEFPSFFIALFFISGFPCSTGHSVLAIGCPLDSKKGFRMIITAGGRELASRWLTQTGEMKTMIENRFS